MADPPVVVRHSRFTGADLDALNFGDGHTLAELRRIAARWTGTLDGAAGVLAVAALDGYAFDDDECSAALAFLLLHYARPPEGGHDG